MTKQLFFFVLLAISAVAQPDKFGTPACDAPNQLARRTAFILCFNPETKVKNWTIYELTPEQLNAPPTPRPSHFRRDVELKSASDADYRGSSMNRGHLVPAADVAWSTDAMRDSFLLSNAAPQYPSVNQSAVRKLENSIRKLASSTEVYVITGTLYDCGTPISYIGRNNVAVPCAFYKAVISNDGIHATLVTNQPHPTVERIAITALEQRTGYRLLPEY